MSFPAREHALKTCRELSKLVSDTSTSKHHILLAAEPVTFRNDTDRELAFRQESNFFYLTGCHVPGSAVLISFSPSSDLSNIDMKLFIPEASLDDMTWSVPPPSLTEAREKYDTSFSIAYLDSLKSSLPKAASDTIHVLPSSENLPSTSAYTKEAKTQVDDSLILRAIHEARITKTAAEIELIRTANSISSRAHETVMRVLGRAVKLGLRSTSDTGVVTLPGDWLIEKEAEAEALFVAACRREGAVHQAYLPICASAHRSSTLHYCCNGGNDKEFAWGPVSAASKANTGSLNHSHSEDNSIVPQVLLIDAGCEHSCYSADITRTIPVGNGGKFTKEASEIYDLVWGMQDAAFKMIKAGVAWEDVHLKCHEVLAIGFLKLGIFQSSSSSQGDDYVKELLDSGITTAFFPHGLGHSLGMDVHDVPSASGPAGITPPQGKGHEGIYRFLRLRRKLEVGMVVEQTVEPGCYFSPHLLAPILDSPYINSDVLKKYAGTGVEGDKGMGGVRIEDAVVILDSGYENLTTVSSDRAWIEGVCSGEL